MEQRDNCFGLYYYNARWYRSLSQLVIPLRQALPNTIFFFAYDPELGRFITEDPIRDGQNWFVYASNNPLKYVDPTGLESNYNDFSPSEIQQEWDSARDQQAQEYRQAADQRFQTLIDNPPTWIPGPDAEDYSIDINSEDNDAGWTPLFEQGEVSLPQIDTEQSSPLLTPYTTCLTHVVEYGLAGLFGNLTASEMSDTLTGLELDVFDPGDGTVSDLSALGNALLGAHGRTGSVIDGMRIVPFGGNVDTFISDIQSNIQQLHDLGVSSDTFIVGLQYLNESKGMQHWTRLNMNNLTEQNPIPGWDNPHNMTLQRADIIGVDYE